MRRTGKSFIREILKVTEDPGVISFAGGLPNPAFFDVQGISEAASEVLAEDGRSALQYSTTEGYLPLRTFIAGRYKTRLGLTVSPDEILITNGSQQCLDLLGKVFLDAGDHVAIERPGYLGAIQAFSLYEPVFDPVPLEPDGPEATHLDSVLSGSPVRIFYGVPNSQNPSGITWSGEKRRDIARILADKGTVFVEDDAYGEIRFSGDTLPSMRQFIPDQTIITGSFSKILSPGMRLGWICAPGDIMEKVVIAKQASDLHSNFLSQQIASRYLAQNDLDSHIRKIRNGYLRQCSLMAGLIRESFPDGVSFTEPQGGMFIWLTLPEGCSSMEVFDLALRKKVAVLPGLPFYVDGGGTDTLRLNFSNSTEEKIIAGVERLADVVRTVGKNS
ncbi:MAG: PLP-dependent aminotransferase family protein [Methanoregulaceae archaeon]|nr:PLP-dependent aminotransferase family protein [Methanoregulaceae archaeon]